MSSPSRRVHEAPEPAFIPSQEAAEFSLRSKPTLNMMRRHTIRKSIFHKEKVFRVNTNENAALLSLDVFLGIVASVLIWRSASILHDLNFSLAALGRFALCFLSMWTIWVQTFVQMESDFIQVSILHFVLKAARVVLMYGMSLCIPSVFNSVNNTLTYFMMFLLLSKLTVVVYLLGIVSIDRRYVNLLLRRALNLLLSCVLYFVVIVITQFSVRETIWLAAVFFDNLSWLLVLWYEKRARIATPFDQVQTVVSQHMKAMTRYLICIGILNLFSVRMGLEDSPYSFGYTIMLFLTGMVCVLIMVAFEMIYSSSLGPLRENKNIDSIQLFIFNILHALIQGSIVLLGACLSNLMHSVNMVFDQFNSFIDLPPFGFSYTPNIIVRTNTFNPLMAFLPEASSNINNELLPSYPDALSQVTVVTDNSSSLTVIQNPSLTTIFTISLVVYFVTCSILSLTQTLWEWKKMVLVRALMISLLLIFGFIKIHPAFAFFGQGGVFVLVLFAEYHRRIFIENLYNEE